MCIYASFLLYFLYLPLQSWCFYSPSVHVSSYNVHFVIVKLLHCFGQRNLVHGQPQRINSWLSKYKQKNSLNIFPGWFISLPMLLPIETILTHDIVITLCTCRCSIKWIINVVCKQPPAPHPPPSILPPIPYTHPPPSLWRLICVSVSAVLYC